MAQFIKFEEYTSFFGKRILPQPAQLQGVKAAARYVAWKLDKEASDRRHTSQHERVVKGFKQDERKLKSLTRMLRMSETDVMVERPEEFSRDFLKHRGMWDLVRDLKAS
jgi:hypothetical protein